MAATERSGGREALAALGAAAMALPAYAAAPPAESRSDYHYFAYREADLGRGKTSNPNRERYTVDSHKLTAEVPLGRDYGLRSDLTIESMSGASPWFITPGENDRPVQVLSGATIDENRQDLLLTLTRYQPGGSLGGSLGISDEDDYRAVNAGAELSVEPAGRQHSYAFGIGFSYDELFPTEGASERFPDRIARADKQQYTLSGSYTQILDARSVLQLGTVYSHFTGFLSDPYKLVFVAGDTRPDTRPGQRNLLAVFARWRRYFARPDAALHVDYRSTGDDWDVRTHSLDARWLQRLGERWQLSPGIRYYSQSQAEFYAPFFPEAPENGLMSSDYRLSPFGAVSLRLSGEWTAPRGWSAALGWEHYVADGDFALGTVRVENPGLLRYDMVNVRVGYRFD